MSDFLQNAIVILLIAAASGYVVLRFSRTFLSRNKSGCGTCGSCPADKSEQKDLVQIQIR